MAAEADRDARVVVCALDGSMVDGSVVEVATQLAVLAEARLALLAVAPIPAIGASEWGFSAWTPEEAQRALELTAEALEHRVEVDCYLDSGNPVRALVELAAHRRALLLVVATRGPGSGRPTSMVASGVSRTAPCPVVIVPEGTHVPDLDTGRTSG
jgi:nucleotide-binding universal stress UspA family protein